MTSHVILTTALVVALFSNAILLLLLILQSSNTDIFKCQRQTLQDVSRNSENHFPDYVYGQANGDFTNLPNTFSEKQNGQVTTTYSHVWKVEDRAETNRRLGFVKQPLLKSSNNRKNSKSEYGDVSDTYDFVNRVEKQFTVFMNYFRKRNDDLFVREKDGEPRSPLQDLLLLAKMQNNDNMNSGAFTHAAEVNAANNDSDVDTDVVTSQLNFEDPPDGELSGSNSQTLRHLLPLRRDRRDADVPENKTSTVVRPPSHRLHEIFSTFADTELAKFDPAVYDLLIPALVHFETMAIREMDSLNSIIISIDLRLEGLENSMLNILRGHSLEPQADPIDNKSEPDSPAHILERKEGFLPATNNSEIFEVHLDIDGSGDVDGEPAATTRPPQTTTMHSVAFYDMYRILSTLEQKVMTLENYNVMSDSELTRVRSEVVKMDDKVTELDRRQRNLQIRTSMHTQKITELEIYTSKAELGIHTALDSYGRVNSRLEAFKDKLTEFKNDLQAVTIQFGRHDQITNELRAADSYKAHDIQEMRKSVFSIEGRLNGLYRVLDLNLDTVRSDLRVMLDRLCANNKLAC